MRKELLVAFGIMAFVMSGAFAETFYYDISSHTFKGDDWSTSSGVYSGAGSYKNDPDAAILENAGPIPLGTYYITGVTKSKGPLTIVLEPASGTDTHGRDNFRIHGDNSTGTASEGCIILGRPYRQKIVDALNRGENCTLEVSD